jgi:hypothetical protein
MVEHWRERDAKDPVVSLVIPSWNQIHTWLSSMSMLREHAA